MSEELDGDGPEIREMIREHEDIALLKPSTCRLCQAKDQRIVAIQRQLAEAQQAREQEHAEVLRLESEAAEVCEEDYSLKETFGRMSRDIDHYINKLVSVEVERDTLRGLLHEAEEVMHFPINDKRLVEVRERITAALKEGDLERQLAEAQQDLKRLSETRQKVVEATDRLQAECDTLRGLLRAAQTRLSCTHLFIGYCPECRDLHQRITAALPKEPR